MSRYDGFRVRGWTVEFSEFSLTELSKISGLSAAHLRVWAGRGHLPGNSTGAGKFTARDVAEVLVRNRLTFGGVPPSESGELGCLGAQALLWHAIVNHDGVCELWGSETETVKSVADFQNSAKVANDLTGLPREADRFLWRGDKGSVGFKRDIAETLRDARYDTHFVIDLEVLAAGLVARSQRPLFSIDVSKDTSEKRVRRLSNV